VIYCRTGEANLSVDSYAGVGIYRTDNGGETWELLAALSETGVPTRIGVIAIDPFDSKRRCRSYLSRKRSNVECGDLRSKFVANAHRLNNNVFHGKTECCAKAVLDFARLFVTNESVIRR
jgi:hypothetical protein